MKENNYLRLFLILSYFSSIYAYGQNENVKFLGEINPSINLGSYYNGDGNHIIYFDQDLMVLIGKQNNSSSENVISLVDLSTKKLGKFSVIKKIDLPKNELETYNGPKIYRFKQNHLQVIPIRKFGGNLFYIILDTNAKNIYSIVPKNYISPKKSGVLPQSKDFFLDENNNLVVGYKHPTIDKMFYQTYSKQSEPIKIYSKNKDFKSPNCYYIRDLNILNRNNEENLECAFLGKSVFAKARRPVSKYDEDAYGNRVNEKIVENSNTVYIEFYQKNYHQSKQNNSFVYTYSFIHEKDKVKSAYISSDFRYVLVNNKHLYSIPSVEIQE